MLRVSRFTTLFLCLFLSACAVHKIDVQQGNEVTQEMLDQLILQMPANKVRFIMGTPLIIDVFHQQRWDYLYSFQAGGDIRQQRSISLFFDTQQRLTRVEGDVKIGTARPSSTPNTLPEEQRSPIL